MHHCLLEREREEGRETETESARARERVCVVQDLSLSGTRAPFTHIAGPRLAFPPCAPVIYSTIDALLKRPEKLLGVQLSVPSRSRKNYKIRSFNRPASGQAQSPHCKANKIAHRIYFGKVIASDIHFQKAKRGRYAKLETLSTNTSSAFQTEIKTNGSQFNIGRKQNKQYCLTK